MVVLLCLCCYSFLDYIILHVMEVILYWANYLEKVSHMEFYYFHIYREVDVASHHSLGLSFIWMLNKPKYGFFIDLIFTSFFNYLIIFVVMAKW